MSYRRGGGGGGGGDHRYGDRFDRRDDFRSARPDYRDRPYQNRDRDQRDYRDFDVRRSGISKPVNELDREVIRGITESSGPRRDRFEDRGPRPSFHRPDFNRPEGGGRGGFERRSFRGRDNTRHEPYGRRPPPFKGGYEERTNVHSRGLEIDRAGHREESDRAGNQVTMNLFDPAVVPKRGFYFEHDNRGAGGGDFARRGRPNDDFRRGPSDRDRFPRDNRERDMYDPRRERRQYESRPAPEGWRPKPRDDRDGGEPSNDRFGQNRDYRFRKPSRTEGKWTHDMYEAEEHHPQRVPLDGNLRDRVGMMQGGM